VHEIPLREEKAKKEITNNFTKIRELENSGKFLYKRNVKGKNK
jgi:hypothetical protein